MAGNRGRLGSPRPRRSRAAPLRQPAQRLLLALSGHRLGLEPAQSGRLRRWRRRRTRHALRARAHKVSRRRSRRCAQSAAHWRRQRPRAMRRAARERSRRWAEGSGVPSPPPPPDAPRVALSALAAQQTHKNTWIWRARWSKFRAGRAARARGNRLNRQAPFAATARARCFLLSRLPPVQSSAGPLWSSRGDGGMTW